MHSRLGQDTACKLTLVRGSEMLTSWTGARPAGRVAHGRGDLAIHQFRNARANACRANMNGAAKNARRME